jgi:hypothetical protein
MSCEPGAEAGLRLGFAGLGGRHGFLSSPNAEKPAGMAGFSFCPISPVYQVGGSKRAKFLWVFWWVSGLESEVVTSVWGLAA